MPVYGAFVSLKREGHLRSCCGYLSPTATLAEAVSHAADRAAKDDPRFPPIAAEELDSLDMEVWLLWGPEEVAARGEDRVREVTIGVHGLQISRGSNRGLLLPGVAVEHHFDARTFLAADLPEGRIAPRRLAGRRHETVSFRGICHPRPIVRAQGKRVGQ